MEKKAKKNTEKKNRKKRTGLLLAVCTGLLSVVAIVLACTVFFRVENIEVTGGEHYSAERVISAAGVPRGTYLVLIPSEQVAHRIWKELPYVDEVQVKKHFPTTLKLVVTDAHPAAKVSSGEDSWIMDAKGRVLEQAREGTDYGCLTVTGLDLLDPGEGEQAQVLDENRNQLTGLIDLLTALRNQGLLERITEIDASSKTEISMLYEGRLRIKFLLGADYERKIRISREIVALIGEYETGTVDLKTERGCFTPTM